ncbi:MAG: hypothetical protein A2020_15170 [Lentisphaerae bacterium GWF2_45_14]|nr:MAG: hypothetical protein A2020_15170 [Lentisphaerae bacterium GWF2_45_14]
MKKLFKYYAITSIWLLIFSFLMLDGMRLLCYFFLFDVVFFFGLLYIYENYGIIKLKGKERLWGIVTPIAIFACCILYISFCS